MRFLQVCNWGLFAIFGVSAASWIAVCLMMVPFPELVAEAGIDMGYVYRLTAIFTVLAAMSAVATWLSMRRHALVWAGQLVLLVAIVGGFGWWWMFK